MQVEVLADPDAVAMRAAELIAVAARKAISQRGVFNFAVSGGRTPEATFRVLAHRDDIEWANVRLFQVDERVAPDGDPARNKSMIMRSLLTAEFTEAHSLREVVWMPVEEGDLMQAGASYASAMDGACGSPTVFDLIVLGLGSDGHTASLIPGDPVLEVSNVDVAVTGLYQGNQRMTLTWPVLDRAKSLLWLVTGESKQVALQQWFDNDPSIPGTLPTQARATLLADQAAIVE